MVLRVIENEGQDSGSDFAMFYDLGPCVQSERIQGSDL